MSLPNNNRQPGILQVRVPALPEADPLDGTELLWLTQLGLSKKGSVSTVAGFGQGWTFISSVAVAQGSRRYAADTSTGSFVLSLPGAPVAANTAIEVGDPNGSWQANPLTVARNGSTIEGLAQDMTMDLSRARVVFAYDGTTWRVFG